MRRGVFLLVALLLAALGWRLLQRAPAAAVKATGLPVSVASVRQQTVPLQLAEVGRVQALVSVALHTRVDGQIAEVPVEAGQRVAKGQLLFKLDSREIDAQIAQAHATVAKDRATADGLHHDLQRYAPMAQKGYVSRQQLQQTEDQFDAARAQQQADAAQLRQLQVQRSYYDIRAPIPGRIGPLVLNLGSQVTTTSTTPLVTINKLSPIYVVFAVPQEQLPALRRAMAAGRVPVSVKAADGTVIGGGRIAYLDNTIDPGSNTLSVHARFDNHDERLWPGEYVNVTATLGQQADARVIPLTALQTSQDGPFVFVLQPDGTVRATPVKVDRNAGASVVISDGLSPGQKVVTEGQLRLSDGARVTVREASPAAPSSAPAGAQAGPKS